jgi:thiamine biosynthesis lipoprotein
MAVVDLYDGEAIGTSGDYQRFDEKYGIRYCHLIHPETADARCIARSSTVIAPSGWLSDVSSKPLYFGDIQSTERMGVQDWLRIDNQGEISMSPSMRRRLIWQV